MDIVFIKYLEDFIFPPTGLFFLAFIGLGLMPMWHKKGALITLVAVIALYIFSTPLFAYLLMTHLQSYPALTSKDMDRLANEADAIVLLTAGKRTNAPEYDGDTLTPLALERTRYAAWLARRTNLPVVITGGRLHGDYHSEAELMRDVLQREFNVQVTQIETKSRTTYESAYNTAPLLKQRRYYRILLVTHGWHMPRSVEAFFKFELQIVPAPTGFLFNGENEVGLTSFFPSTRAAYYSKIAMHEIIGRVWYQFRYY